MSLSDLLTKDKFKENVDVFLITGALVWKHVIHMTNVINTIWETAKVSNSWITYRLKNNTPKLSGKEL